VIFVERLKIIGVGLILLVPSSALAVTDAHIGYCDDIESTAAALKCITDHKEKAESELRSAFESLNKSLQAEQTTEFMQAHKDWLIYRDSECVWESQIKRPALAKLYELSCVTKLTENRTKRLLQTMEMKKNPDKVSEFGKYPRWLNALYKEYPSVIWDIKSQEEYDLTCDENAEHVIQGVSLIKDSESDGQYTVNAYVAITDGKAHGKPLMHVMNISEKIKATCDYMPDIMYHSGSSDNVAKGTDREESVEVTQCAQEIYLSYPQDECETVSISYKEQEGYVVQVGRQEATQVEESKK